MQLIEFEAKWQQEARLVNALIDVRQQILCHTTETETESQTAVTEGIVIEANELEVTDPAVSSDSDSINNTDSINNAIEPDTNAKDAATAVLESPDKVDIKALLETQKNIIEQLQQQQQDDPLVLPLVDSRAVANVVSDWTGIPVGKMMKDELQAILELSTTLSNRVIDQDHGM